MEHKALHGSKLLRTFPAELIIPLSTLDVSMLIIIRGKSYYTFCNHCPVSKTGPISTPCSPLENAAVSSTMNRVEVQCQLLRMGHVVSRGSRQEGRGSSNHGLLTDELTTRFRQLNSGAYFVLLALKEWKR